MLGGGSLGFDLAAAVGLSISFARGLQIQLYSMPLSNTEPNIHFQQVSVSSIRGGRDPRKFHRSRESAANPQEDRPRRMRAFGLVALTIAYLGALFGTSFTANAHSAEDLQKSGGSGDRTQIQRRAPTASQKLVFIPVFPFQSDGISVPNGNLFLLNAVLYGVSVYGGSGAVGTVFRLNPKVGPSLLYDFEFEGGQFPLGRPIVSGGRIWGTCESGFRDWGHFGGSIWSMNLDGGDAKEHYAWPLPDGPRNEGGYPQSGLTLLKNGDMVGTTLRGGLADKGTLFKLSPAGTVSTIAHFGTGGLGASPYGEVVELSDGTLVGPTFSGGSSNRGTVYAIKGGQVVSVTSFGASDGFGPGPALVPGPDGLLYGTTTFGGGVDKGNGTIFSYDPKKKTLKTIARLTPNIGAQPGKWAPLAWKDGYFYGTAERGGAYDRGTVFRVSLDGTLGSVFNFTGVEGAQPSSGLVEYNGRFHGVTSAGGRYQQGTWYSIYWTTVKRELEIGEGDRSDRSVLSADETTEEQVLDLEVEFEDDDG